MAIPIQKALLPLLALCVGLHAEASSEQETQAQQLTQQLGQQLQTTLKQSIAEHGLVGAIDTCNLQAEPIAHALSQQQGIDVGRTALRVRNPNNQPTDWERTMMQRWQEAAAAGTPIEGQTASYQDADGFHYLKAIPTQPVCLNCHGQDMNEEVQSALQRLYPDDQATGFQTGELRGAFRVFIPAR